MFLHSPSWHTSLVNIIIFWLLSNQHLFPLNFLILTLIYLHLYNPFPPRIDMWYVSGSGKMHVKALYRHAEPNAIWSNRAHLEQPDYISAFSCYLKLPDKQVQMSLSAANEK